MAEHPTHDELSGFLRGTLPPESTEAVADHIEHCPPCQETINALDQHTDTLLRFLREPPPPPLDPACNQALEKAAAIANAAASPPSQFSMGAGAQPSVAGTAVGPVPTREAFLAALQTARIVDDSDWSSLAKQPAVANAADGKALARVLVEAGTITKFQATLLYQNKPKALQFGEYVVVDKIGAGGMGQVYKARHRRMKRMVAIKVLPKSAVNSAEAVKRFQREVEAAARLVHPNIVIAHDAGQQDHLYFLVMEYVDGKDLAAIVKAEGPLAVEKAVDYILQAARGLDFAHTEGVVHRDIKPGNLLLDKRGVVKILDMGLARLDAGDAAAKDGLTQSGQVMGTVDYMAPEQAMDTRVANAKADIYSLGCTLYRVVVGDNIYSGETLIQKLLAHRENPIPSLAEKRPDVPASLDAVFQKMVAKSPDDRYESMHAVVEALEQVRHDLAVPAASKSLAQTAVPKGPITSGERPLPAAKGAGRRPPQRWIMAAAAAGLLFIVCGVWIYFYNRDGKQTGAVEVEKGGSFKVVQKPDDPTPPLEPATSSVAPLAGDFALRFDSADDKLDTSSINIVGRNSWTLEAWVTPRQGLDPGGRNSLVLMVDPVWLGVHAGGPDGFNWTAGGPTSRPGSTRFASGKVEIGKRMHIALVRGTEGVSLYVNGVAHGEALPIVFFKPQSWIRVRPVGNPAVHDVPFRGDFDEVRLSSSTRYHGNFTPDTTFAADADTVALYRFDEGTGDTLHDASEHGHDAKIIGAKWVRADGSPATSPNKK